MLLTPVFDSSLSAFENFLGHTLGRHQRHETLMSCGSSNVMHCPHSLL